MACKTTLYHLSYTSVNGAVTKADNTLINNTNEIASLIETSRVGFTEPFVVNGGTLAYFQDTKAGMLQTFGDYYNFAFLAPAASVAEVTNNIAERSRDMILVASVPKAPFYSLIVCLLTSALFGFLLTLLALRSHPWKNKAVQLRLGTAGLVSSLFEHATDLPDPATKVDALFSERIDGFRNASRLGIARGDNAKLTYVEFAQGEDGESSKCRSVKSMISDSEPPEDDPVEQEEHISMMSAKTSDISSETLVKIPRKPVRNIVSGVDDRP
ncbi:hypothetical protein BP5796_11998 [Coleophoma crateriformis]|uniref:Uncharacterized protein n=1 Tax=Coleophoma crateriformis TaxID=565419 RepID=A0A3D8QC94_9HELO|nr:hypothetical protein BP5796_11998 [Coleophoma crateriformis]